ncbi:helix-turn-helix domain-containing protein [Nocardia sp. NPDC004260]
MDRLTRHLDDLRRLVHTLTGKGCECDSGAHTGRNPAPAAEQADLLRSRAAAGVPRTVLAREFGASRETVYAYLRTVPPRCGLQRVGRFIFKPIPAAEGRILERVNPLKSWRVPLCGLVS